MPSCSACGQTSGWLECGLYTDIYSPEGEFMLHFTKEAVWYRCRVCGYLEPASAMESKEKEVK
jgi:uncharacterized Zn finger protein